MKSESESEMVVVERRAVTDNKERRRGPDGAERRMRSYVL